MSVAQESSPTQHEDVITRVARAIFAWRYPQAGWDENLFSGEREDCLLLAAQFREIFLRPIQIMPVVLWSIPSATGIDERWRQAFVKGKIAEVLAELVAGVPIEKLDAEDRAWVKAQAEQLVDDAVERFDSPVKDNGSQYQPQDEPEHDSIEIEVHGAAKVVR